MQQIQHLTGLIAATHTPMREDGSLNFDIVEKQAAHLIADGVVAAFICGSTGEAASLSLEERLAMTRRWAQVVRGTPLKLIVHVGCNALPDARALAADAQKNGAYAIAALAPNYFKPAGVGELVDFCQALASAAPELPFYYYDIPVMTGLPLPMDQFLAQGAQKIPTLAGMKFTNGDLAMLLQLLRHDSGRFNILFGYDEYMLAALTLGVRGAVGSGFNFAAPLYLKLIDSFIGKDLEGAQMWQERSIQVIRILVSFGYFRAAKAIMSMLGVDCGPTRLPIRPLTSNQIAELRAQLESIGFFEWGRKW